VQPNTRALSAEGSVPAASLAFLVFALLFLEIPVDRYISSSWPWTKEIGIPVAAMLYSLVLGGILALVPTLRRNCRQLLAVPIPPDKRIEIALVTVLHVVASVGVVAGMILWIWCVKGEPGLARWLNEHMNFALASKEAFSAKSFVSGIFISVLVAPIIEELVFRGTLYPAWASRWGWFPSAILTSALFAAIHSTFVPQFVGSLLFIGLLRRTGSLRACIVAHAAFNFIVWYPLIGRHLQPGVGRESGEISFWIPQLVCLAIAFFAVPIYLWVAGQSDRLAGVLHQESRQS
jgi:membrane protease YdiL (CAAX protease family)